MADLKEMGGFFDMWFLPNLRVMTCAQNQVHPPVLNKLIKRVMLIPRMLKDFFFCVTILGRRTERSKDSSHPDHIWGPIVKLRFTYKARAEVASVRQFKESLLFLLLRNQEP